MTNISQIQTLESFNLDARKHEMARLLAKHGLPVFPVHNAVSEYQCSCEKRECSQAGKHPRTPNGFKDASCDHKIVDWWWSQWPLANIGLRTGRASGVIVLDIDPRNGGDDSFEKLKTELEPNLNTWTVHTGGGGRHFYFKSPGLDLPSRNNLLPGIDLKSDGGYVIAPPSDHKSGNYYSWHNDRNPQTVELAPCPDKIQKIRMKASLLNLANSQKPNWRNATAAGVSEGGRNSTMTSIVGALLRVGIHPRDVYDYAEYLNQTKFKPPLEASEVEKIVVGIMKRELVRRNGGAR